MGDGSVGVWVGWLGTKRKCGVFGIVSWRQRCDSFCLCSACSHVVFEVFFSRRGDVIPCVCACICCIDIYIYCIYFVVCLFVCLLVALFLLKAIYALPSYFPPSPPFAIFILSGALFVGAGARSRSHIRHKRRLCFHFVHRFFWGPAKAWWSLRE